MITDEGRIIQEMLEGVVRSLVDHPEAVTVEAIPTGEGFTFRIRVGASDPGKLIGKNGRTARALRVIVGANAAKLKRAFHLDITA